MRFVYIVLSVFCVGFSAIAADPRGSSKKTYDAWEIEAENFCQNMEYTTDFKPDLKTVTGSKTYVYVVYDTYREVEFGHYLKLVVIAKNSNIEIFISDEINRDEYIIKNANENMAEGRSITIVNLRRLIFLTSKILANIDDKERVGRLKIQLNNICDNYFNLIEINEEEFKFVASVKPNEYYKILFEEENKSISHIAARCPQTMNELVEALGGYVGTIYDSAAEIHSKEEAQKQADLFSNLFRKLTTNNVKIYVVEGMIAIDRAISRGHGHSIVGKLNFSNSDYVYKVMNSSKFIRGFWIINDAYRKIEYVENCIKLFNSTIGIVKTLPVLIIHKHDDTLDFGILMELVDGIPVLDLIDSKNLNDETVMLMRKKTVEIFKNMTENGYNIDDFYFDNIIWDNASNKMTVIDIEEKGFNYRDDNWSKNCVALVNISNLFYNIKSPNQ